MLQEKTNLIEVVGLLSEVNLEEKSKDGKDYLTGKITVKTHEKIDGIDTDIEIPFQVYASKLTKAGKDNPAYQSLMGVKNNMVSIAAAGDEGLATMVRVYQQTGGLRENIWVDKNRGVEVCTVRPNASFFNAVSRDAYEPCARFETAICVMGIDEEVDRDGVQTGRLKIAGAVPGWNGSINKIDYIVQSPAAVEHIQNYWEKGDTVIVAGAINYTNTVETYTEEMGFGEPLVKKRTRSKKELIITRGSGEGLPTEEAFPTAEILSAMQERKQYIEKLKEEAKQTKPAAPNMADYGF